MQLVICLKQHNIATVLYPITFESLISRARNAAVAHFLSDAEATHLLFIDSDIEFRPDDVFTLLMADKPVVCAGYAQKWLSEASMKTVFGVGPGGAAMTPPAPLELCTKTSVHLLPAAAPEKLMLAKYATTGFLLVQKTVFESLARLHPELAYQNDIDGYHGANPASFYNFFPININPETKRFESEDYGFSRLWTDAGGEIFVATDISLKHHGWFAYPANLYRQLQAPSPLV